eukprot:525842-Prorocentrum_minimum.AAC.1
MSVQWEGDMRKVPQREHHTRSFLSNGRAPRGPYLAAVVSGGARLRVLLVGLVGVPRLGEVHHLAGDEGVLLGQRHVLHPHLREPHLGGGPRGGSRG